MIIKKTEFIISVILIELFFNIYYYSYDLGNKLFSKSFGVPEYITILINISLTIIAIILILNVVNSAKKEQELISLKNEQRHNANLASFLRELKHDINNQLFVVNGFIQLGKTEEAAKYAREINEQFEWMEDLLNLNQPELTALILSKLMDAKNLGISVAAKIANVRIPSFSGDVYVHTVGNLLDNAIQALEKNKGENNKIAIEISSNEKFLVIVVKNSGLIPEDIASQMFKQGFTTKPEKDGHGLGLHIVQTTMQKLGGNVKHYNEQNMTVFELSFPL